MHDATDHNLAFALSRLSDQDLDPHRHRDVPQRRPVHLRRRRPRPGADDAAQTRAPDLQALLNGRDTWTVAD